jgi:DNA-binding NtrC family response regulator
MHETVLVLDPDPTFTDTVAGVLEQEGYRVGVVHSAAEARAQAFELYPDVLLLEPVLPDGDGAMLVTEIRRSLPQCMVIVVTGHGSIASAVSVTRRGAVNYLTKPIDPPAVLLAVRKAIDESAEEEDKRRLRPPQTNPGLRAVTPERKVFYPSQAMIEVYSLALLMARQEGVVLLQGESGTGKDRLARWIHRHSPRADGPFFTVNCAALPRDVAESELFGHEAGSFTGAKARKRGLVELADGGTLLLNEIGEMDLALQSKLLAFFDTRTLMRVGGERMVPVNARVLAATNCELRTKMESGAFRRDLFYRLNVLPIRMPTLRERREDIPVLADEILDRLVVELNLSARPVLTPDLLQALEEYDWPGNVRELRNLLERAVILARGQPLERAHLGSDPTPREWSVNVPFPEGRNLNDVTQDVARKLILEAIRRTTTRTDAARLLGLTRHNLAYHMRRLGLLPAGAPDGAT